MSSDEKAAMAGSALLLAALQHPAELRLGLQAGPAGQGVRQGPPQTRPEGELQQRQHHRVAIADVQRHLQEEQKVSEPSNRKTF